MHVKFKMLQEAQSCGTLTVEAWLYFWCILPQQLFVRGIIRCPRGQLKEFLEPLKQLVGILEQ